MLRSFNKFLVLALASLLVLYTVPLTPSPISSRAGRLAAQPRLRSPRSLQGCAAAGQRQSSSSSFSNQKGLKKPLSFAPWRHQQSDNNNNNNNNKDDLPLVSQQETVSRHTPQEAARYLVYVPYAGATNQLISIWHATMIAKHLNRTLLLPNLSPNVHVQEAKVEAVAGKEEEQQQDSWTRVVQVADRRIKRGLAVPRQVRSRIRRPGGTRWSRFFDIEGYSRQVGVEIEELDDYLIRTHQHLDQLSSHQQQQAKDGVHKTFRQPEKRWLGFWGGGEKVAAVPEKQTKEEQVKKSSKAGAEVPIFADPIHCYSEGGYGMDRRMDVTGRQFLARYGISPKIRPTPFLDPKLDNTSIWARWRLDKVIERYQQPAFTDGGQENQILCLSHVYRLLPGGRRRAWVEFGQYFKYTDEIEEFVDETLVSLLKGWKAQQEDKDDEQQQQQQRFDDDGSVTRELEALDTMSWPQRRQAVAPFVGVHLRRGDFERHCLGIASPLDPNGWNRCYPSTQHVISLVADQERAFRQAGLDLISAPSPPAPLISSPAAGTSSSSPSSSSPATLRRRESVVPPSTRSLAAPNARPWPVLVLSNERDPGELAKSDAQGWIRVDHGQLGTVERFGEFGPIMIDGALLARASLLVGVEYSTYFKTAGLRAETWHGGRTLFVT